MLGRIAGLLDKLEAAEKKAKKEDDQLRIAKTKAALLQSVGKLTSSESIDSAAALRKWLKESQKEA